MPLQTTFFKIIIRNHEIMVSKDISICPSKCGLLIYTSELTSFYSFVFFLAVLFSAPKGK